MRVIRDIHSKGEARNVTVKLNHPSSRDRRRVSLIKPVSRVCPGCHHIIDHRSSIIDHRSSHHRSDLDQGVAGPSFDDRLMMGKEKRMNDHTLPLDHSSSSEERHTRKETSRR
jgi:hypothetical protein